jgi:hypothetical protein
MKKTIYIIIVTLFLLASCNDKPKKTEVNKKIAQKSITESKGYELMKNNCFICHFPKPDPSKKGQMIAPPMLRIQEHYKPMFSNKNDFVTAIKTWVNNPTEDKVKMPGAVRKFKIMPKLAVADEDLQLIAETLYDIDFGSSPKMQKGNQKLELNNGKKWQLNEMSIKKVNTIIDQLKQFKSDDVNMYQNFGKTIFDTAKSVLLSKDVSDNTLTQLQAFFHNVEGNMHELMTVNSIDKGKKQINILNKKFNKFLDFFE